MQLQPNKSAGPTPWFDLLNDHCEDQGGFVTVESFPLERRTRDEIPPAEFVLEAYWGNPPACKGTTSRARRIEHAAEQLCRQFDLDFADA